MSNGPRQPNNGGLHLIPPQMAAPREPMQVLLVMGEEGGLRMKTNVANRIVLAGMLAVAARDLDEMLVAKAKAGPGIEVAPAGLSL